MISEALMKVGSWDIKFDPETTPWDIRHKMTFFSNIIITPAHSGTITDFATLKAQSIYSGLITRRALRRGTVSGLGLLGYLATGKGSAGIWHSGYESFTYPLTFSAMMARWFGAPGGTDFANGLRYGTAYTPTATTVSALQSTLPDMKQGLDTIAAQTGNEYRVTAQGLVDYGTTVFQQRKILISPDVRTGETADWRFFKPTTWDPEGDVEDYRNTGRVLTEDKLSSGYGSVVWTDPLSVPKMRTWNNSYVHTAIYTNEEATIKGNAVADATAAATALGRNRSMARYSTDCKIRATAITRFVNPGDSVYVYDGLEGIVGTTHTGIPGQDFPALSQRVYGISWPLEQGMGVYLVDGSFNASPDLPVVTDITKYISWETGQAASLDLGPPVSLSGNSNLTD